MNWLKAAGGLATAFDVTTKGILHAVFEVWHQRLTPRSPAPHSELARLQSLSEHATTSQRVKSRHRLRRYGIIAVSG